MTVRVILPVAATLVAVAAPLRAETVPAEAVRQVEVRMGSPFNLKSVGGPDKTLVIQSENTRSIRFTISDPGQMREVIRYDRFGYPYTELVPLAETQTLSKTNGISLSGTVSKLYPLYSDARVTVYFFDTLATRQNHRMLVIRYHDPADAP